MLGDVGVVNALLTAAATVFAAPSVELAAIVAGPVWADVKAANAIMAASDIENERRRDFTILFPRFETESRPDCGTLTRSLIRFSKLFEQAFASNGWVDFFWSAQSDVIKKHKFL